jgi:hypothetical protein
MEKLKAQIGEWRAALDRLEQRLGRHLHMPSLGTRGK